MSKIRDHVTSLATNGVGEENSPPSVTAYELVHLDGLHMNMPCTVNSLVIQLGFCDVTLYS